MKLAGGSLQVTVATNGGSQRASCLHDSSQPCLWSSFDAARPTLEAYSLDFISQVWLAWLVPQTQGTRVCDDGPSAALAEQRKTRKQSRCDEMHISLV